MSGCSAENKKLLTEAFNAVDTNKSGTIDAGEVEAVLKSYYSSAKKPCDDAKLKTDVAAFIKEVDKNADGQISLDEFLKYFAQVCK